MSTQVYLCKLRVSLSFKERVKRWIGTWWDIVNTSAAVLFLTICFFVLSVALITDNLSYLPLNEMIWQPFEATVDQARRAETGLSILSVAVSGASAAALYLIRVGTRRWALIRRIGLFHLFAAEDALSVLHATDADAKRVDRVFAAYLDGSQAFYEDINSVSGSGQVAFETLRLLMLTMRGTNPSDEVIEQVAVDQLHIALLCLGSVTPIADRDALEKWFCDISTVSELAGTSQQHRSLARGVPRENEGEVA